MGQVRLQFVLQFCGKSNLTRTDHAPNSDTRDGRQIGDHWVVRMHLSREGRCTRRVSMHAGFIRQGSRVNPRGLAVPRTTCGRFQPREVRKCSLGVFDLYAGLLSISLTTVTERGVFSLLVKHLRWLRKIEIGKGTLHPSYPAAAEDKQEIGFNLYFCRIYSFFACFIWDFTFYVTSKSM